MKATMEVVKPSPGLSFCFQDRNEPLAFQWHFHAEYELTIIVRGKGTRFVGDDVSAYQDLDLALVGPNVPHAYETSSTGAPCHAIIIQFSDSLFAGTRLGLVELRGILRLLGSAKYGVAFGRAVAALLLPDFLHMTRASALEKLVTLWRVLDMLSKVERPKTIVSKAFQRDYYTSDPDEPREDGEILQYVFEHAGEPLSLRKVSAYANRSVPTVCRFFKRRHGCTFHEYLTRIRIARACKMLIQTDLPIYLVCYQSGFDNVSNFNRHFRAMKGMTPTSYRRLFQRARESAAVLMPAGRARKESAAAR